MSPFVEIRSIILNLKDKTNPALRDSIVQGDLDALGLCNLSKEDMASESLKASNKAMETENLFNSRGAVEIAVRPLSTAPAIQRHSFRSKRRLD